MGLLIYLEEEYQKTIRIIFKMKNEKCQIYHCLLSTISYEGLLESSH